MTQPPRMPDLQVQRAAIEKLDFLVGNGREKHACSGDLATQWI
jgi:hypothetical protein